MRTQVPRVALDAMGGDSAPSAPVAAAILASRAWGYEVQLVGLEAVIRAELERQGARPTDQITVAPASQVIEMGEHPASAVRAKRDSSLAVGLERVRSGEADCFVSAGNTGAVLATALLRLRRIEGITSERPALAAILPTVDGSGCVLVDAGANVDVKPEWLAQFALMGSLYAELALGKPNPRVATLSNGEEEGKGNAVLAAAVPLIRALPIRYIGHIEGKDVTAGIADVAVVDGFAGNIFLKGAEGVVSTFQTLLRQELTATLPRKLLALGLRPAFGALRERLSYESYGGAPLLGVNGVCIVAHGRSSPLALQNAMRAGVRAVEQGLVQRIRDGLAQPA